jgi:hypothetical protein
MSSAREKILLLKKELAKEGILESKGHLNNL